MNKKKIIAVVFLFVTIIGSCLVLAYTIEQSYLCFRGYVWGSRDSLHFAIIYTLISLFQVFVIIECSIAVWYVFNSVRIKYIDRQKRIKEQKTLQKIEKLQAKIDELKKE